MVVYSTKIYNDSKVQLLHHFKWILMLQTQPSLHPPVLEPHMVVVWLGKNKICFGVYGSRATILGWPSEAIRHNEIVTRIG